MWSLEICHTTKCCSIRLYNNLSQPNALHSSPYQVVRGDDYKPHLSLGYDGDNINPSLGYGGGDDIRCLYPYIYIQIYISIFPSNGFLYGIIS